MHSDHHMVSLISHAFSLLLNVVIFKWDGGCLFCLIMYVLTALYSSNKWEFNQSLKCLISDYKIYFLYTFFYLSEMLFIVFFFLIFNQGLFSLLQNRKVALESAGQELTPILLLAPIQIGRWLNFYHNHVEPVSHLFR